MPTPNQMEHGFPKKKSEKAACLFVHLRGEKRIEELFTDAYKGRIPAARNRNRLGGTEKEHVTRCFWFVLF